MSTTRIPYDAATPDRTSFDTAIPLSPLVSYIPAPNRIRYAKRTSYTGRLDGYLNTTKEVVKSNSGMLLVASAQLFFSLMNVWVKKLNSLNPPVPAFEVSSSVTTLCTLYSY